MAALNIRNLSDDVHRQLRILAAKAGHSMEAEAREILTRACRQRTATRPTSDLQQLVDELYEDHRPKSAVDELIEER
ncbi:MAG: hypothetical protein V3U43_00705, partial [Pseudomonadales bacterium]